jgi:hypothetical protein
VELEVRGLELHVDIGELIDDAQNFLDVVVCEGRRIGHDTVAGLTNF